MGYEVRTPVFEGPFDLLLHLILREEVDLWEVSLTTIVDAYLTELERMGSLDLALATEFLLIAATLVELKARRLLPAPAALDLDEELLRFEERDLLLARLLECKTFKDASHVLAARMAAAERSLPRSAGPEEPFRSLVPDPLERVRPGVLRAAALRVLAATPVEPVRTDHIAPIRLSVREVADEVFHRLPEGVPVTFRELVAATTDRMEIAVRFLAILELYKRGVVDLEQVATFAELSIVRLASADPELDATGLDEWDDEAPAPRASHPA